MWMLALMTMIMMVMMMLMMMTVMMMMMIKMTILELCRLGEPEQGEERCVSPHWDGLLCCQEL